jgi:hypothetical protein
MDIAEPPGGGKQDHDTMQAAAVRPVTGPTSSDTLAAIGGLDLPAGESHPELAPAPKGSTHEPIPGEREVPKP